MNLKALRCFWALGKNGSLTRAGIELGISEPAISKRIKTLERYLDTKLYEARGGKIRLTLSGQKVLEMAVGLFERLDEFERGLSHDATTGTVTVAAEDPIQFYLLPSVVERYARLFPKVRLRLVSRTAPQTAELVRQNEVDIGILPRPEPREGLVFHPWRTFEAYLILPRGHPLLRHGTPAIKSLLNRETVLRYPLIVGEGQDVELREALLRLGLPLNVALEVGNSEVVKRFVSAGLGGALVSGICLTEADRISLEILEIPPAFGGQTTYGVLMRERKYMDAALRGLLPLVGVPVSPVVHLA